MIDTNSHSPTAHGGDKTDLLGGIALGVAALAALATYGGVSLFVATRELCCCYGTTAKNKNTAKMTRCTMP
jgi:hypothetical protein